MPWEVADEIGLNVNLFGLARFFNPIIKLPIPMPFYL